MAVEKRKVGRPRGTKTTPFPLKLRNELLEYVRSQKNRNGFINDCIKEHKERTE